FGTHVLSDSLGSEFELSGGDTDVLRDLVVLPSGDVVGVTTTSGMADGAIGLGGTDAAVFRIGATPWMSLFGATDADYGRAIAATPNGDLIVGGSFSGTMVVPCAGGDVTQASAGSRDIFVAKLSGTTGACEWIVALGGGALEDVRDVAVGDDGAIYLAG